MALPWVDFVWTIKKWLSLYPTDAISNLPVEAPAGGGNYTVLPTDYYLTASSATPITYTMLSASANPRKVLKFKNRGAGELTLSGATFFTDSAVSSLVLVMGDMVTLTSDGTYWNVGD